MSEAFCRVVRIGEGDDNVRCRRSGSIVSGGECQRRLETKLWPDLDIQQSVDPQFDKWLNSTSALRSACPSPSTSDGLSRQLTMDSVKESSTHI